MPETINCPTCGVLSYATDAACANCGTALTGVAPTNHVAPVGDVPPQPQSPHEPAWPSPPPDAQQARALPDTAATNIVAPPGQAPWPGAGAAPAPGAGFGPPPAGSGYGPPPGAPGGGPFQAGTDYGYGQAGYGGSQPRPRDKGAVRSMVLGIVSLVICGIFFGPAAIIEGRKSLKRIEASGGTLDGDGFARAGVILGIIGTIGAVLLYGLYAWAASRPKYRF